MKSISRIDEILILLGRRRIGGNFRGKLVQKSGIFLARDTEIAVGCWQPSFPECNPIGDVHMFRMGLWAALFCVSDPAFRFIFLSLYTIKSFMEKNLQVPGDDRMRDKGEGVCLPQLADVQWS